MLPCFCGHIPKYNVNFKFNTQKNKLLILLRLEHYALQLPVLTVRHKFKLQAGVQLDILGPPNMNYYIKLFSGAPC